MSSKRQAVEMNTILTPISPGELLDKLTILEIKCNKITDAGKLANVRNEHGLLSAVAAEHIPASEEIATLTQALLAENTVLWDIEDDIRNCERQDDFGAEFVRLARAVYVTNDRRAAIKRQINLALGSGIVEEKSYAEY